MDHNLRENARYIEGKLKEAIGQISGSEGLELKGKLEAMTKEVAASGERLKEKVAEKANDLLDDFNQWRKQP
ncbi:MAG TPA: hypothetical protein PKD52_08685 [Clostridiales bacterium]|nr:hypothetical protein [Clostridiales bacterium]